MLHNFFALLELNYFLPGSTHNVCDFTRYLRDIGICLIEIGFNQYIINNILKLYI